MSTTLSIVFDRLMQRIHSLAVASSSANAAAFTALHDEILALHTTISEEQSIALAQAVQALTADEDADFSTVAAQIQALMQADAGLLSFDAAQTTTETQKAQGRSNLGAASSTDVSTAMTAASSAAAAAQAAQEAAALLRQRQWRRHLWRRQPIRRQAKRLQM